MGNWHIPRRTFLRGLGTAIALPALDAMLPATRFLGSAAAATATKAPTRMGFIYVPNGVNMAYWRPETAGTDYVLPKSLAALEEHRKDINIISGLANKNAFGLGDGGGDHARACASYLTAAHPKKTAGADLKAGISVDQVAAGKIGDLTRFPSLELSCDKGQEAGSCDSGYSCAYQFNISWRSATQPMNPEVEPQVVFDRLFGAGHEGESAEARTRRQAYDKSVLDFVQDHARSMQGKLGTNDRRKLDEYFTAIREVEKRIAKNGIAPPTIPDQNVPNFNAEYTFERHMRLMFDIMVLAFQTDSTRITTFLVGHDQSNRPYPFVNAPGGHHSTSHHRNSEESLGRLQRIDEFHVKQFAYLLERMKSVKEGEGTLLDNCMITYGSGISDGNRHNHDNLPVILAGRGGGTIKQGRHIVLDDDPNVPLAERYTLQGAATASQIGPRVPMANLYSSMLDRMDVPHASFGDSNGKLEEIAS